MRVLNLIKVGSKGSRVKPTAKVCLVDVWYIQFIDEEVFFIGKVFLLHDLYFWVIQRSEGFWFLLVLYIQVKLALQKVKADKIQLESDNKSVSEQLNEMKSLVGTYSNRIVELETLLQTHENENKETSNLMEKLKNLHNEHCNELNQQIDNLRKQVEEKSELIIQLEKKLREMLNEDKMKDINFNELREYANKLELLVEEKRDMIEKYEEQNKVPFVFCLFWQNWM